MSVVLGSKGANSQSPNPRRARGRNSPVWPAMPHHKGHERTCKPVCVSGQRAFEHLPPSHPNTRSSLFQKGTRSIRSRDRRPEDLRNVKKDTEVPQGTTSDGRPIMLALWLYRR